MAELRIVTAAARRYRTAQLRVDRERETLRKALRDAHADGDGASLRQLGVATELSFARIHQLIKGR